MEQMEPAAQIELLEQNITYLLQEIDANFAVTHKNLESELLPRIERLGKASKKLLEICKPWLQFFEIFARPIAPETGTEAGEGGEPDAFNYPLDADDQGSVRPGSVASGHPGYVQTPGSARSRLALSLRSFQTPVLSPSFRSVHHPVSTLSKSRPALHYPSAARSGAPITAADLDTASSTSSFDLQGTPSRVGGDADTLSLYSAARRSVSSGCGNATFHRPPPSDLSFDTASLLRGSTNGGYDYGQPNVHHSGESSASDMMSFRSTPSDVRRLVAHYTPHQTTTVNHGLRDMAHTPPLQPSLPVSSARYAPSEASTDRDMLDSQPVWSPATATVLDRYDDNQSLPASSTSSIKHENQEEAAIVGDASFLASPAPFIPRTGMDSAISQGTGYPQWTSPAQQQRIVTTDTTSPTFTLSPCAKRIGRTDRRLSVRNKELQSLLFDDPEDTIMISELTRKYDTTAILPEVLDDDDDDDGFDTGLSSPSRYTSQRTHGDTMDTEGEKEDHGATLDSPRGSPPMSRDHHSELDDLLSSPSPLPSAAGPGQTIRRPLGPASLNAIIGDETVQVVLSNESPCAPKSTHWSGRSAPRPF
ncbi:hypothetical protein IWQ60_000896 [Tieghemiomyces parasiticus]|uniref:DASH complex subunit ASK1 n=1 Tax=Tieghemiomyces parasiticus TaxID=78921 RepID=A0A9W8AHN0_9FUNG|nr:hypothetical protein IWQ60_000896 [Tieghemiomyces parasiticus]